MTLQMTSANKAAKTNYDYVIVGSGFGGSVSALRLSQKGYKVLVIEKGSRYKSDDFANSNWNFKRWLWLPYLGFRGIFNITFFKHVTVMSGVGVGGGSLTYGATLPTPKSSFFNTGSWATLNDWEHDLKPHYKEALRILGATQNPHLTEADYVIKDLAKDMAKEDQFSASRVGIFFSSSNSTAFVEDPYFEGKGPLRRGCIECGSCMTGCNHDAKNSLDKNYLYLANQLGANIVADHVVTDVIPAGSSDDHNGYFLTFNSSNPFAKRPQQVVLTKGVIFSGGVLGTVPLLMKLKSQNSLPKLSQRLGEDIRTNNETLTAVTSFNKNRNFAQGVTIGSILNTDEHSHLEPINYNENSGAWKFLLAPRAQGLTFFARAFSLIKELLTQPVQNLRVLFSRDWGKRTLYLLFMQHLDSTLTFKPSKIGLMRSTVTAGNPPSCHIPESDEITRKVEKIIDGKSTFASTELFTGAPSTAHILGGAVMGKDANSGVIDDKNSIHGYKNLYVCDGSAVSANPGVNPSLTITAITEWAMSHIKPKHQAG